MAEVRTTRTNRRQVTSQPLSANPAQQVSTAPAQSQVTPQSLLELGRTSQIGDMPAPVNRQENYIDSSALRAGDPFGSMGGANPMGALGQMLSGQVNTAALDPVMATASRRLGEQFNEQVMPGIRGGAQAAGQYGSSRQGIAEGLAARGLGYAMGDMSANMYNNAFNQAQQNMAGAANNLAGLGFNNANQDASRMAQAMQANQGYNLGLRQNDATFANLANQRAIANQGNSLGFAGLANQSAISGQNADVSRYATDVGARTATRGQDVNKEIAQLQNKLGYAGLSNQSNIASMNNATTQYGMGLNYDLGLRQNDLGFGQLGLAINNSNVNNQIAGANLGLTAYNTLMNGNNIGLNAANNMYNQPLNYYTQFSNVANSLGGQGGVTNQTTSGGGSNPLMGIAGAATALQPVYNQYAGGRSDGYGYSYQQGGTGGAPTATGSANFLAPY